MKTLNGFSHFKLYNAEGFGEKSLRMLFKGLQEHKLKADDVFEFSSTDFERYFPELGKGRLKSASFENIQRIDEDKIYTYYEKMKDNGIEIIPLSDENYPKSVLNSMKENAPVVLFSKGYKSLFNVESFSIVGSRNANDKSLELTYNIAKKLADNGFNIVSGFAKGVDTKAHLGALENYGTTSMVLSFGLFELAKQKVFESINWKNNSLAISQFDLNEKWRASNAMTRNKLVCGLSKGVIVIETGKERDSEGKMSGTFDAGKSALSLGIPVFVISPNAECFNGKSPEGNQDLIKLGGIEVYNFKQILDYFLPTDKKVSQDIQKITQEKSTEKVEYTQTTLFA